MTLLEDIPIDSAQPRPASTRNRTCLPCSIGHCTPRSHPETRVLSDAEPTWTFRQLSVVNEWLTGCPADNASYRELCGDPERLATTVVVQLAEARGAHVIGDFMLRPTTQVP